MEAWIKWIGGIKASFYVKVNRPIITKGQASFDRSVNSLSLLIYRIFCLVLVDEGGHLTNSNAILEENLGDPIDRNGWIKHKTKHIRAESFITR